MSRFQPPQWRWATSANPPELLEEQPNVSPGSRGLFCRRCVTQRGRATRLIELWGQRRVRVPESREMVEVPHTTVLCSFCRCEVNDPRDRLQLVLVAASGEVEAGTG